MEVARVFRATAGTGTDAVAKNKGDTGDAEPARSQTTRTLAIDDGDKAMADAAKGNIERLKILAAKWSDRRSSGCIVPILRPLRDVSPAATVCFLGGRRSPRRRAEGRWPP